MSSFYHPKEYRKAKKYHRCTYCGEAIPAGESYTYQTGVYDGRWFILKMHDECFDGMADTCDDEYTPYSNDRPARDEVTHNANVTGLAQAQEKTK